MQERPLDNVIMEARAIDLLADDFIAATTENNKNETINKLKSMLILHLEVIKKQTDQLLSKDKQISKLKQENADLREKLAAAEQERSRKTPRKNPAKTPAKEVNNGEGKKVTGTPGKRKSKQTTENVVEKPKEIERDGHKYTNGVSSPLIQNQHEDSDSNDKQQQQQQIKCITSTKQYLTCAWKKSLAEQDADREPELRSNLEIPSWTECELVPCYTVDADMEDLSDEAFQKRHQKWEVNEKRRKRWDVQRLREVRTVEKLKQRYMKEELQEMRLKTGKPLTQSFYPDVDSLKFIQIVDDLPVLAFGEPIPCLPATDFALPWQQYPDNSLSPSTSFTKTRFFKKN